MFVSSHICMIAVRSFYSNALIIAIYLPKFPLVCHFNVKIISLFFTNFHKNYTLFPYLGRNCGMYRKNMMFNRRCFPLAPPPGTFHRHGLSFPWTTENTRQSAASLTAFIERKHLFFFWSQKERAAIHPPEPLPALTMDTPTIYGLPTYILWSAYS